MLITFTNIFLILKVFCKSNADILSFFFFCSVDTGIWGACWEWAFVFEVLSHLSKVFGGRAVMIMGSPDRADSQFSWNISPEVLIQMCTKQTGIYCNAWNVLLWKPENFASYQRFDSILSVCIKGHSGSAFLLFQDHFCMLKTGVK